MPIDVRRLVTGEIGHRKLNFALGCVAVAIAAAAVVGSSALLRGHDARAEWLIEEKERETREEMARLEDDYRIIMRRMGYNVLVLHADEQLAQLDALGYPQRTMPEEYAQRLGQAGIETLNHLLPLLQHRFHWVEQDRTILLTGVRGQVAIVGKEQFLDEKGQYRSPIMSPVPVGAVAVGYEIGADMGLSPGDEVAIRGESFTVHRVNPRRGTADDNTIWIDLAKAQQWLGLEGKINGILALECVCHPDELGKIVAEVRSVLPDTQVREFSSLVRARAEARNRAAEAHQLAVAAERAHRAALRSEREQLAGVLVPLVVVAAGVWIGLLTYSNARDRRSEIGIFRALGVRESLIVRTFLFKAALTGVAGSLAGAVIGLSLVPLWMSHGPWKPSLGEWGDPGVLVLVLLLGPALACTAAWLPASYAVRQDPAVVLSGE